MIHGSCEEAVLNMAVSISTLPSALAHSAQSLGQVAVLTERLVGLSLTALDALADRLALQSTVI